MSGFNTKKRNNSGEYEITFYTDNRQDFKKVQKLCRELIDHNKEAHRAINALEQEPKPDILEQIIAEINTSNRGTCDYYIVDRIEEIINEYQKGGAE